MDSQNISDSCSSRNSTPPSSPLSYFPSDLEGKPIGYICALENTEVYDLPTEPAPIADATFVTLSDDAEFKTTKNQLYPTDVESRLAASAIFLADKSFDWNGVDDENDKRLPVNVQANIHA